MESLYKDIWRLICYRLPINDILNIRLVSKSLSFVINNNDKILWRRLVTRDFLCVNTNGNKQGYKKGERKRLKFEIKLSPYELYKKKYIHHTNLRQSQQGLERDSMALVHTKEKTITKPTLIIDRTYETVKQERDRIKRQEKEEKNREKKERSNVIYSKYRNINTRIKPGGLFQLIAYGGSNIYF